MTEEDLAWFIYTNMNPDLTNEEHFRGAYKIAPDHGTYKSFIGNPMMNDASSCAKELLRRFNLVSK